MMPRPERMKVVLSFADGATREIEYRLSPLRNGDNPHQAGFVGEPGESYVELIEGRGMGFTNHIDLSGYAVAFELSRTMAFLGDFRTEAVVINKHTNPAVLSLRAKQIDALRAALSTDTESPFGGVMAVSSPLTRATAQHLVDKNRAERFVLDVLAAPGFEEGCDKILSDVMKNLRIVDVSSLTSWDRIVDGLFGYNMKWTIGGKPVVTEVDRVTFFNARYGLQVLSRRQPTNDELKDAYIAWIAAKAIQSNSFAFVKDSTLLAQCGGQTNRVDSAKFAHERAVQFHVSLQGAVAATDSFIFNREAIDLLHGYGVAAVVHPTRKLLTTGSLKPDEEILNAVNEHNMVMIRPYLLNEKGEELPWRVFRHL